MFRTKDQPPRAKRKARAVEESHSKISELFSAQRHGVWEKFHRVLPFGEYISDRWEKAKFLGFGEGSSIYDSSVVIGKVSVGAHTWVGPFTLLDGSGGLTIGNFCSISAGVQIYTHDSVQWSVSGGESELEYGSVDIGNNTYIGPNTVVARGISIGHGCTIGANSFVNSSIPSGSKAWGNPAVVIA